VHFYWYRLAKSTMEEPDDVRVDDGYPGAKRKTQDGIGAIATDMGQGTEVFFGRRNISAEVLNDLSRHVP